MSLICCHHGLEMTVASGKEFIVTKLLGKLSAFISEDVNTELFGDDYLIGKEVITCLKDLRHLNFLDLSGNLSNLVVLDLNTITTPSLMSEDMSWISGLSSLKSLDWSYVNLRKAKKRDMVFYMMSSLVKLSLSECSLTNADLEHDIPGIPGPFKLEFPAFFAKHNWFFSKAEFVKLWAP
nr:hypothetical protein [Tanacetum cinerariifolium]